MTNECRIDLIQSTVVNELGKKLINQSLNNQDSMMNEVKEQVDRVAVLDQKLRVPSTSNEVSYQS